MEAGDMSRVPITEGLLSENSKVGLSFILIKGELMLV